MEFQIQIAGLDQLITNLARAPQEVPPILQRALSASGAILAKHTVKGVVPWRSGFLAQTFKAELSTGMLTWSPTASYAPYVEFGTAPHVILPKERKALFWPGAKHPVAKVNHPGSKPNQFMERIVAESQAEIDARFGNALTEIIAAIAAK